MKNHIITYECSSPRLAYNPISSNTEGTQLASSCQQSPMLRSNRATWLGLTGLTVFVAFGTLLYATGVLDYGTYLPWRLKGHGSNIKDPSFGDLNSTTPPKIAPHCVSPVEEWDSSRFLKGRPTKLFRGVRPVLYVACCLIQITCRKSS